MRDSHLRMIKNIFGDEFDASRFERFEVSPLKTYLGEGENFKNIAYQKVVTSAETREII